MNVNADVKRYVDEQPVEWRTAVKRLRAECRKHLRGHSEQMAYGMPSYQRDGEPVIAFKNQARYLSFYVMKKPVLDADRARLAGLDVGKGCIRYRRADQIDWHLVVTLLEETAASDAGIC